MANCNIGFCVLLSLLISMVIGLPIKDDEIDELIYRLQELRNQNHYEEYDVVDGVSGLRKQPIDLERKPLLYDYYANTLNPIYDKRNFDEIDSFAMSAHPGNLKKRNFDEIDSYAMSAHPANLMKRNFDEIDSFAMPEFRKRMAARLAATGRQQHLQQLKSEQPAQHKRNFDEIDAFAMPSILRKRARAQPVQQMPRRQQLSEFYRRLESRNNQAVASGTQQLEQQQQQDRVRYVPEFNEVERTSYADLKRYMDGGDGDNSSADVEKRNFDEIDSYAMPQLILQSSLKRKHSRPSANGDGKQKKSSGSGSSGAVANGLTKREVGGQSAQSSIM